MELAKSFEPAAIQQPLEEKRAAIIRPSTHANHF
jgi:hypothetical protein